MLRRSLAMTAAMLMLSSCASARTAPSANLAPMLSVESFLQAANTRDHYLMASIFGTADGPIASTTGNTFSCAFKRIGSWVGLGERCVTWQEIELRMDAIALILRHDDYRVLSESTVAGRMRPTTRILVDIQRGTSRYTEVPFVVVQTTQGRWLVEEIGLERMTASLDPFDGLNVVAEGGQEGHFELGGV
jgi:hypothetical protein